MTLFEKLITCLFPAPIENQLMKESQRLQDLRDAHELYQETRLPPDDPDKDWRPRKPR